MSRTECCYDNAPIESFFYILKVELVHQQRRATRSPTSKATTIEERIHSALGYITLEQAERNAS